MSDSFEEDYRAALLATSLADTIAARISWAELPQARPRPLIVLWDITTSPEYTMKGADGLESRIVQCDCRALTFAEAKSVARSYKAAIEAIAGITGGTKFHRVFFRSERDMGSLTGDPTDPDSCVQVDALVWYRAA